MSEEATTDEAAPVKLTVCGFDFTQEQVQPFTEGLMDAWATIRDERGYDDARRRRQVLAQRVQNLQGARVRASRKAVGAIEKKLEAEHAKPIEKWDARQIDRLTDKLDEVTAAYLAVQAEHADEFSSTSVELADEMDDVAGVEEECFLAMAHHVATQVGESDSLEEWLRAATSADYSAAQKLVRAGETPFLSRRGRRQARGRGSGS
jgi:hypothetical protein